MSKKVSLSKWTKDFEKLVSALIEDDEIEITDNGFVVARVVRNCFDFNYIPKEEDSIYTSFKDFLLNPELLTYKTLFLLVPRVITIRRTPFFVITPSGARTNVEWLAKIEGCSFEKMSRLLDNAGK